MDLDALAGVVSYKHTKDSVMTVTAAVDRITLQHPLSEICDLELSGKVTFATGRSSMEVSLQVVKAPEEGKEVQDSDILMTCAFTMVWCFLTNSLKLRTDCYQRYLWTPQPRNQWQLPR
jgi:acyl-coenzyme A thioesterase 9